MARARFNPRSTLLAAATVLCLHGGTAQAQTLVVAPEPVGCQGTPADHGSLQAAIDAAAPGATVRVCPGVYAEAITITKAIRVCSVGGPGTTVLAPVAAPGAGTVPVLSQPYAVVEIAASGATLGGHATGAGDACGAGDDAAEGQPVGFTLKPRNLPTHVDPGNGHHSVGVYIPESGGDGPAPTGTTVEGNVVSGFTEVGISIGGGAHGTTVRGNTLTQAVQPNPAAPLGDTYGIMVNLNSSLIPTNDVAIEGNTIAGPRRSTGDDALDGAAGGYLSSGILVLQPNDPSEEGYSIIGNTITGRFGTAIGAKLYLDGGVAAEDSAEIVAPAIEDNTIAGAGSGAGIVLGITNDRDLDLRIRDASVAGNTVQGVERGIHLSDGVEHAVVYDNALAAVSAAGDEADGVDPTTNGQDMVDTTSGGIYAFGLRNLFYDNRCGGGSVGPVTTPETTVPGVAVPLTNESTPSVTVPSATVPGATVPSNEVPAGLCALSEPPVPTGLRIDGPVVDGVAKRVGATAAAGPLDYVRIAPDSDGRELGDYAGTRFLTRQWVTLSGAGGHWIAVQARSPVDGAISRPVRFFVPVEPS